MRGCCPSIQVATYPELATWPNTVQEATEDQLRAYEQKLRRILAESDRLTGEALESAIGLVREMQERLLGRLAQAVGTGRFDAFWLPWLQGAVQDVAEELAQRYGREVGEFLPRAWDVGIRQADAAPVGPTEEPPTIRALPAAGPEGAGKAAAHIHGTPLPHLNPDDVGIAAQFTPDLITSLEEETVRIIGREVAVSVLSGETPGKLMERLGAELGDRSGPWTSVAYRAEVITRTETARLQDLAAEHRMEQRQALDPEEEVWWTILVAEVNGWPCPYCQRIADEGPYRVGDPDAPRLPLHPNCRCKRIRHFPAWEPAKGVHQPDEQREAGLTDSENEEPTSPTRSPANKPEVGLRVFPDAAMNERGRAVPLTEKDVDRIERHYAGHPFFEGQDLDHADFDLVSRYAAQYGTESLSFQAILAGGDHGAAVFLHELTEARLYVDAGIDLFDDIARADRYDEFHGQSLVVEHRALLGLAQSRDFQIQSIGSLIRWNPVAQRPPRPGELPQWRQDLDSARLVDDHFFLDYDEGEEAEVLRFYQEITPR